MARALAPLLLCLTLATACGDEGTTPEPGGVSNSDAPAQDRSGSAATYAEDDPEYLLAFIDGGDPDARVPDSDVAPYDQGLDLLARYCRESRSLLADQVVTGVRALADEKGLEYTNLEMLTAYGNAMTGKLGRDQKCADIFAGVIAITSAEE